MDKFLNKKGVIRQDLRARERKWEDFDRGRGEQ